MFIFRKCVQVFKAVRDKMQTNESTSGELTKQGKDIFEFQFCCIPPNYMTLIKCGAV
jgi:hypothetical protein